MAVAVDVTTELAAAVDAVCAAEPSALADGASVQALYRQLDRLSAVVSRASAAFDAGRAWENEGDGLLD